MSDDSLTRRRLLEGISAAVASTAAATTAAAEPSAPSRPPDDPFLLGLNTSTIRGQNVGIVRAVDIAAEAGYGGIEPWIDEIETYERNGGSLPDLKKRIENAGLRVESAIGFFDWAVDDEAQRRKGMESARRSMDLVQRIGGTRIAAPPAGATRQAGIDLNRIAERYRALLTVGEEIGVAPQVEIWGFSQTLGRLSEAVYVAVEAGRPGACILPDVYHLYRGGSDFSGLSLLGPKSVHVFHLNDYPAHPPRRELTDADRVYPGDGVAPLRELLKSLRAGGFRLMLSLEVFNRAYWKQDPRDVARTGLRKIRELVEASQEPAARPAPPPSVRPA